MDFALEYEGRMNHFCSKKFFMLGLKHKLSKKTKNNTVLYHSSTGNPSASVKEPTRIKIQSTIIQMPTIMPGTMRNEKIVNKIIATPDPIFPT
jgi:hypothetical protein